MLVDCSSVNLAKNDIDGTNIGDNVGQHMPLGHHVEGLKVDETRWPDFTAIGRTRAIGDHLDTTLTLRCLDSGVNFASRNMEAFGKELKMMNQRFH